MTTMTDDISARIAALEAEIRDISTRLAVVEAEIRSVNAMQSDIRADLRQLNDRIDRLGARIERVFWAVISVGLIIGAGIVGAMLTMLFRLT